MVLRAISAVALAACMVAPALAIEGRTGIDFGENRIGLSPEKFDFAITGQGQPGRWTVVRDMTGFDGVAVEQSSDDPTENRFSLAIYKGVSLRNVAASVRLKVIKGTMQTAGIAFRFVDSANYYVINASALEQRVDLFRVVDGRIKRIGGTDANVVLNSWHKLGVIAADDQFTISFDNGSLFTVFDRTFLNHGHVGLWTEEDNVARFEQLEIKSLPRWKDR